MAAHTSPTEQDDLSIILFLLDSENDVRKWSLSTRADLLAGGTVALCLLTRTPPNSNSESELIAWTHVAYVPKYALAAISETFWEYWNNSRELNRLIFDVGNMDTALVRQHEVALKTLEEWMYNLCTTAVPDLQAPTFYSEISLRHIARQLHISHLLPARTQQFIVDAQTHTLQPWQITELLFSCSSEPGALIPVIPRNDPLLLFLARKMTNAMKSAVEVPEKRQLDQIMRWLGKEQHMALKDAVEEIKTRKLVKGVMEALEGKKARGHVASLSHSGQIAYAVSELNSHRDPDIQNWLENARRELDQGGRALILLSQKKNNDTPAPTDIKKPTEDRHLKQDYYVFAAPKLAMVVLSPVMNSFFEQNASADKFKIPNPHSYFKPKAIRTIAVWLRHVVEHPKPKAAMDIRVAMQLLGMEKIYLSHFIPTFKTVFERRVPTMKEAQIVLSHLVMPNDVAIIGVLAERLTSNKRSGNLPTGWDAFIDMQENMLLKLAMDKAEGDFRKSVMEGRKLRKGEKRKLSDTPKAKGTTVEKQQNPGNGFELLGSYDMD
ncbi:hypothetical protein N0V90_000050 [Kalmusia sp. IMI 367209]|nr:hypothetical protein N0V90_000050 [Kalmusia sp. IMI 367209]